MNLEQLTKHQIVLLMLLISFVTSIATGIVTVSLLGQTPSVTRVVNQIVERTVEKVVPSAQSAAAVTTTEKTVVVKDDDLAAQSIAKVQKSMVRITLPGSDFLVARGVIIAADGTTLTDRSALEASLGSSFEAILSSGERVAATPRSGAATSSAILILDLAVGTSTGFAPATLADSKKLVLGQSVIRIGGKGADTVGAGVVATLPGRDTPEFIAASVSSATPGSVLITIFGDIIGLATGQSMIEGSEFYSIPVVVAPATQKPETSSP
ncbi:MAG: hypothetical protein G01um101456_97 [Parcubacteria group bacterium Gr01-1014_56]|nr:MAG: hypothetical protein G01um101456_97 [Parcubacteria group bacterium Gr01-1014_56]